MSTGSARGTFAGVCVVYDDHRWLPFVLESVYDRVAELFVLMGHRPWHGTSGDPRATLRCIGRFHDPERKIRLVRDDWPDETAQRNAGLRLTAAAGHDFCFVVDADEIYDPVALRRMMRVAAVTPRVDAWTVTCVTYWKSLRYRIHPPEPHTPVVFVRVGRGVFTRYRLVQAETVGRFPPSMGVCHHMSYARSDEEVRRKIATFSHAGEVRPEWYERVWRGWDTNPGLRRLHPTHPRAYDRAVEQPYDRLPPVLRRLHPATDRARAGRPLTD